MDEPFRMEVGAVFNVKGRTIATGKVERGVVRANDRVEIATGTQTRSAVVQRVETFSKILPEGRAGQNIGLALEGIQKDDVQPGCIITGGAESSQRAGVRVKQPAPPARAAASPAPSAMRKDSKAEDPRFRKVETEYARQKAAMDAGRITPDNLDQIVNDLIFEMEGRYWMIGANSGTWYSSSGDEWEPATPPGR